MTPTTTIGVTDQLVIEIPTKTAAGNNLYADNLGLSYNDGDYIPIDILDGNVGQEFMSCRIYHGDQANHKPAKIVCGKFSETIDNTKSILYAIEVINPSVSSGSQFAIPFIVYTQNLAPLYKSNYNLVENAVYLRTYTHSVRNDVGYIYSSSQTMQTPGQSLHMITRNYNNINVG